jgi:hypothetical protein
MTDVPTPGEPGSTSPFNADQRARIEARSIDQDRTLGAVHRLEAAMEEPARGRQGAWWADVTAAIAELEAVTAEEEANAGRPDSLLADLKRTQPRLRTRVRGVRSQYAQFRRALSELREELEDAGDRAPDVDDIRQRLAWLTTALRHQRARESDLIYEAYFDAFNTDLARENSDTS